MAYPLPLKLPPVDVIRHLRGVLQPNAPRRILDAGSGTGRNARFLAGLGHFVVSLDRSLGELRSSSVHPAVFGDVRQLPFGTIFDIAIMNEVTHMLPNKTVANDALTELRRVTYQGGLNVVSGYLAVAGRANAKNTAHMFGQNELRRIYEGAGWHVLHYAEQILPNQYEGQGAVRREIISSRSMIIAQRPWR